MQLVSSGMVSHILTLSGLLPQGMIDAISFLLVLILAAGVLTAVAGIISSLIDIATYAVIGVITIGLFFAVSDALALEGAMRTVWRVVEFTLDFI